MLAALPVCLALRAAVGVWSAALRCLVELERVLGTAPVCLSIVYAKDFSFQILGPWISVNHDNAAESRPDASKAKQSSSKTCVVTQYLVPKNACASLACTAGVAGNRHAPYPAQHLLGVYQQTPHCPLCYTSTIDAVLHPRRARCMAPAQDARHNAPKQHGPRLWEQVQTQDAAIEYSGHAHLPKHSCLVADRRAKKSLIRTDSFAACWLLARLLALRTCYMPDEKLMRRHNRSIRKRLSNGHCTSWSAIAGQFRPRKRCALCDGLPVPALLAMHTHTRPS